MKVSVVVPVYNREKFLDRCLLSIRNQTYENIEIVVINDGSTDRSHKVVKKHQLIDERIVLIDQENSGIYKARQKGIQHSKGDAIMHLDSDDYLESCAIELLVNKYLETNADMVIGNFYLHRNSGKRVITNQIPSNSDQMSIIRHLLLGKLHIYVWGRLFKKNILENLSLPYDSPYNEDVMTNFFLACNNKLKLALVEEPIVNYIVHRSSFTLSKQQDQIEEYFEEYNEIEELLMKGDFLPDLAEEYAFFKSNIWIGYCRMGGLKSKDRRFRKAFFRENYFLAKNYLTWLMKLEMLAYDKNLQLGRLLTNTMLYTKSLLKY